MPIYDYKCPDCDNRFEKTVPVDDRHSIHCDVCEGGPCDICITSAPSVVFRGINWADKDHAKYTADAIAKCPDGPEPGVKDITALTQGE